jgi:hypothetical protein
MEASPMTWGLSALQLFYQSTVWVVVAGNLLLVAVNSVEHLSTTNDSSKGVVLQDRLVLYGESFG